MPGISSSHKCIYGLQGSLFPPEYLFIKEESFCQRTAPCILWSSRVAEYEYVIPKYKCRISRQTTPKYAALVLIILSCRHLRNSKSREKLSLNPPFLPKNRSSKTNSIVRNPLSGSFITWEDWLYHRRKECKLIPHPDKSCHKLSYFPSILLRAHLSFLKIIYTPLSGLNLPFPFAIKILRWHSF